VGQRSLEFGHNLPLIDFLLPLNCCHSSKVSFFHYRKSPSNTTRVCVLNQMLTTVNSFTMPIAKPWQLLPESNDKNKNTKRFNLIYAHFFILSIYAIFLNNDYSFCFYKNCICNKILFKISVALSFSMEFLF
jgi:hypothetical protein